MTTSRPCTCIETCSGSRSSKNWSSKGARGAILRVPEATLELFDVRYGDLVDDIEVGRPLGERARVAVRVDDLEDAARAVAETGAEPMAPTVETPWGDRNQRFRARDGIQLTLFQSP
jgi:hypothetical protein